MTELYLQMFCFCFCFFVVFIGEISYNAVNTFAAIIPLFWWITLQGQQTNLFISQHYRNVLCDYRGGSRIFLRRAMPDPDLEIREARSFRPPGGVGGGLQKFFFRPFKPHFGLKIRRGRGPPGPLPWIRYWRGCTTKEWRNCW